MSLETDDLLRVGRLEDRMNLYEPLLTSLQGLASIPNEIGKIHTELGTLKESRVETRERLTTLFKAQTRAYDDTVRLLEEKTKTLEKEISECPIDDVSTKLTSVERELATIEAIDSRLEKAEKAINSFKLRGWDLLLRAVPWALLFAVAVWAAVK